MSHRKDQQGLTGNLLWDKKAGIEAFFLTITKAQTELCNTSTEKILFWAKTLVFKEIFEISTFPFEKNMVRWGVSKPLDILMSALYYMFRIPI